MEEQGPFVEVWVKAPVEECARRDVKGLYARARAGEIREFTGISDPYEPPARAEVVVGTSVTPLEESVAPIRSAMDGSADV